MLTGFLLAKFVHLAGVILWLGAALALSIAHRTAPPASAPEGRAVRRQLRRASVVEHGGFLLMLVGAGGLVASVGLPAFLAWPLYLRAKVYLTVAMALPLEVVDMTFVHGTLRRLSVGAARDPAALSAFAAALERYDTFRRGAAPFVALLVPTYLVLAVFKPQ